MKSAPNKWVVAGGARAGGSRRIPRARSRPPGAGVVAPGRLLVGPYQGTLGCLHIEFGRGVCGRAAAEQKTVIVPDVDRFPGHIVCDARAKSEIVVPVFDAKRSLVAVLDIDFTFTSIAISFHSPSETAKSSS